MDRRPTVAYVGGWLGKRNLGDEALFEAFQYLFPEFSFLPFDGGRLITGLAKYTPVFRSGFLAGGTLLGKADILMITSKFLELHPELIIFGAGVEEPSFWP